jgi:hypothetical protein
MRLTACAAIALPCALWMSGCDPSLTLEAKAGCGEANESESRDGPEMLPGRECKSCHRGLTAAGTVFATLNATCDTGVENATIEILDMDGNTALTLTSNRVGNFFTKARLPSEFKARVTGPDGESQQMQASTSDGNCSRCHRLPGVEEARGRLSLFIADAGFALGAAAGGGAD